MDRESSHRSTQQCTYTIIFYQQLWHCIVGWISNTFGSKVYPPIMCITFPGYISVASLFSGIDISCIPALPFDPPTQSDTLYICSFITNFLFKIMIWLNNCKDGLNDIMSITLQCIYVHLHQCIQMKIYYAVKL